MSVGRFNPMGSDQEARDPLAQALGSLPAQSPPRDGWERLRNDLALSKVVRSAHPSKRTPRRRSRWLALAAVLAVAAITLRWQSHDITKATTTEATIHAQTSFASRSDQLIKESARLESMLTWMTPGARNAEALALDVSLVDRLQWVDHLLADPHSGDATREVLWGERVDLLAQRVALSQRESMIAFTNDAQWSATL